MAGVNTSALNSHGPRCVIVRTRREIGMGSHIHLWRMVLQTVVRCSELQKLAHPLPR